MRKITALLFVLCLGLGAIAQNVNVSFKLKAINVDGVAVDTTEGVYLVGDVTSWKFRPMEDLGDHIYIFDTTLHVGDTLSFYFILVNSWDSAGNQDWNYYKRYREYPDTADVICNPSWAKWKGDRWMVVPSKDTLIYVQWGLCGSISGTAVSNTIASTFDVFPNPAKDRITVLLPSNSSKIEIFDLTGKRIKSLLTNEKALNINLNGLPSSMYIIKATSGKQTYLRKIMVE
ncbi:MAG: T9SS type A sorting domain-containing protein [Bacteroidales bacterium]|nr:T9SS type A sorting domain-containing protein [Bacteroidales bacterium]